MFRELEPLWVMLKEEFSTGVWRNVMWTLVKRSVLLLVRCWAWGQQVKGQERKWTWSRQSKRKPEFVRTNQKPGGQTGTCVSISVPSSLNLWWCRWPAGEACALCPELCTLEQMSEKLLKVTQEESEELWHQGRLRQCNC